jgi:hypothetical protein
MSWQVRMVISTSPARAGRAAAWLAGAVRVCSVTNIPPTELQPETFSA